MKRVSAAEVERLMPEAPRNEMDEQLGILQDAQKQFQGGMTDLKDRINSIEGQDSAVSGVLADAIKDNAFIITKFMMTQEHVMQAQVAIMSAAMDRLLEAMNMDKDPPIVTVQIPEKPVVLLDYKVIRDKNGLIDKVRELAQD